MSELPAAVETFLTLRRIAVAGVSRTSDEPANVIYRKLRTCGYEVFAVNPSADEVERDRCYHDIASIPGGVEGVVVVTPAGAAVEVIDQCRMTGVRHVWIHKAIGPGSVSAAAIDLCRESRISVIPGGCPMLFLEPVDLGHRCIRWFLKVSRGLPETVPGDRNAA